MVSKSKNILYSFRRCPYAIRARIALTYKGIDFDLREIDLKNKSAEFLQISPKGTVPVLVLSDGRVIDESLGIVDYALNYEHDALTEELIANMTKTYIPALHRFKYHDRYDDIDIAVEEKHIINYLKELDALLSSSNYLKGNTMQKADIAILPFVRQLQRVDEGGFDSLPFESLKRWFYTFYHSDLHAKVMAKD
jgi:glutathione S-transferase